MAKRTTYHIVPDQANGWAITKDGSDEVRYAATQRGAEKEARRWALKKADGEIVIHRRDGKIRDTDTIYPANKKTRHIGLKK